MKTEAEKDKLNAAVAQKMETEGVAQYSRDVNLALTLVIDPSYKFRLERLPIGTWGAAIKGLVRTEIDAAVAITEAWLAYMNNADEGLWIEVESSNVGAIRKFDNDLYVRFLNGTIYRYKDVPVEVVEAMKTAESVGRFLNKEIKPTYECEKVEQ